MWIKKFFNDVFSFVTDEEYSEKTQAYLNRNKFLKPFAFIAKGVLGYSMYAIFVLLLIGIPYLIYQSAQSNFPKINISFIASSVLRLIFCWLLITLAYRVPKYFSSQQAKEDGVTVRNKIISLVSWLGGLAFIAWGLSMEGVSKLILGSHIKRMEMESGIVIFLVLAFPVTFGILRAYEKKKV